MGHRPSCRSCRHCVSSQGAAAGWCHLRRLAIHSAYSSELWCHHWTARPPRLPLGDPQDQGADANADRNVLPPADLAVPSLAVDAGSGDAPDFGDATVLGDDPTFGDASVFSSSQQLSLEALLPQF